MRLVIFLLDISARMAHAQLGRQHRGVPRIVVADDRLKSSTGLSAGRIQRSLSRLLEARVLEQVADDPPGWFRLALKVMQPAALDQYVSWGVVIPKIAGRIPAILLLRAVLDLAKIPWDWTRLTYDQLAARASYSLGMAQRGMTQLLESGVVERASHSGRSHDYRLSSWALGRGPIPEVVQIPAELARETARHERIEVSDRVRETVTMDVNPTSTMAVEIGGLVLRVPVGTEIRMTVGADGELHYEIGSELKITRRG
jgi:DNA-binding IclR family transcriptional regulator